MKSALVFPATLLFALAASGAGAQTAPTDDTATELSVAERPNLAYDAVGLRAGAFLFFPSFEFGASSDDNIYRTPEEEERDSIRSIRPRIFGVSQWRNHRLELDMGLDASQFEDADKENVTNWFTSVAGRLDISRDAWIKAALGVRELHEERGDPNSPRTVGRPVSRDLLSARVEAFRQVNRLSFGVEGSYTDLAYEDSVETVTGQRVVQNDRDRGESDISAWVGWDLAPDYQAYLRGTRYIRRYDRLQGGDRYNRDSDGMEIVAGVRIDLGGVLAGELFGGYREQSYDQDDRLPTAQGASYGGAVTWNVTPLTTIRGDARRTVGESTLRQASGYLSTALLLSLDHELRRNLIIGGNFGLTSNEYEGIAREDDIVTGSIRGTWLISRQLQLDFGYRFQQRDSTVERDDYDKNLFYLDVRLQF